MGLKRVDWATEFFGFSSDQRTYQAAREGLIPCVRIGRQIRFDEDTVREFARRGGGAFPEKVQVDSESRLDQDKHLRAVREKGARK